MCLRFQLHLVLLVCRNLLGSILLYGYGLPARLSSLPSPDHSFLWAGYIEIDDDDDDDKINNWNIILEISRGRKSNIKKIDDNSSNNRISIT